MIIREHKINVKAEEIKLAVSFSKVDVLKWLRLLGSSYNGSEENRRWFLSNPQTEQDIKYFFENTGKVLGSFEEKWRKQLSAWAWNVAVREKYFEQSSTPGRENEYYPSEILLKRVGRPKKEEE